MPSVMQVCRPSAFTSRTISVTRSMSLGFGLRHAAPMQKRVAPCSFAACAAAITSASGISLSAATPVSKCADCGQ